MNGGKHGGVYKRILEGGGETGNAPLSIDKLKEVITGFLSQKKETVASAGYPIEWLENSINGLMLKEKETEQLEVSL